eukprot:TRINITY_DN4728_c0_g1_i2.p1 TRINITY_DN4728_c0_g1~~TRINITY_DN4728_c0_g1_i2.p1  ORF type:complete len:642 (-),score=140.83 TRINITY_DN4728_c0_g1_i2:114-2039(-)
MDQEQGVDSIQSLPNKIALLCSALKKSNDNLRECHKSLEKAIREKTLLEKRLSISKQARVRDAFYLRSKNNALASECEGLKNSLEVVLNKQKEYEKTIAEKDDLFCDAQMKTGELGLENFHLKEEISKLKKLHQGNEANMKKVFELKQDFQELQKLSKDLPTIVSSERQALVQSLSVLFNTKQFRDEMQVTQLESQLTKLQERFYREQKLRKALHNSLVEMRGNIRVFCRVKPALEKQTEGENEKVVQVLDEERISINKPKVLSPRGANTSNSKVFEMDKVLSSNTTQDDIFSSVRPLLTSLIDGYNLTIMAYGSTGTGKTYTMQGTLEQPGIIPRSLQALFSLTTMNSDKASYTIEMSMMEIYNETVKDLLTEGKLLQEKKCEIVHSNNKVEVQGVNSIPVNNYEDVTKWMNAGFSNRSEASTLVNSNSSRSHSIVVLKITSINKCTGEQVRSKLSLVDLAGSECVGMTGTKGEELRESSYINKSLSALGDVLTSLSQGKRRNHIPYRNSKLTTLLQDSLGGDSKMLLFINISPDPIFLRETSNTLSFGSKARQVLRPPPSKQIPTESSKATNVNISNANTLNTLLQQNQQNQNIDETKERGSLPTATSTAAKKTQSKSMMVTKTNTTEQKRSVLKPVNK